MTDLTEHDYIQSYTRSVEALSQSPSNKDFQHQAVLSLARTGSLDLALLEYERYGLDKVRNHEDIMALGGRLSKDLYLRALRHGNAAKAKHYAQNSADQYDAAFQDSQGYYSGINAASMAFLADMPQDVVLGRVKAILDILPPAETLTAQDHYFITATRAECFLLNENMDKAAETLKAAISFDPLNYTAHAATIKQFRMILKKKGKPADWLSSSSPPRAIHYAGHIDLDLSSEDLESLCISVSDHLQHYDIGFGYGALAAGSDIIIAEALLQEGAELHVILPCASDVFIEHSVKPFGKDWVSRFKTCLSAASSVKTLTASENWPSLLLNQLCARFAMGQAVLRSQYFGTPAAQLLIWNGEKERSYTAHHAKDWEQTGRTQIILPVKNSRHSPNSHVAPAHEVDILLQRSDAAAIVTFEKASDAVQAALDIQAQEKGVQIGLHVNIPDANAKMELSVLTHKGMPNGILLSEALASLLAHQNHKTFNINFAGLVTDKDGKVLRSYALS